MPTDDRSHFRRIPVRLPILGIVAELEIDAVKKVRSAACGTTNNSRTLKPSNVGPRLLESL
jgi:hypothetical protein